MSTQTQKERVDPFLFFTAIIAVPAACAFLFGSLRVPGDLLSFEKLPWIVIPGLVATICAAFVVRHRNDWREHE